MYRAIAFEDAEKFPEAKHDLLWVKFLDPNYEKASTYLRMIGKVVNDKPIWKFDDFKKNIQKMVHLN